jgi:hypothetical protein
MVKQYNFRERDNFAKKGTSHIIKYLESQKEVKRVIDVSEDIEYQQQDIDLLVELEGSSNTSIEVKVDGQINRTGNFFLETISNDRKNTLGCFMYSRADEFYYYDIKGDILYIFGLEEARGWLISNMNNFREVATSTPDSYGRELYKTIGRIVPTEIFIANVTTRIIRGLKDL